MKETQTEKGDRRTSIEAGLQQIINNLTAPTQSSKTSIHGDNNVFDISKPSGEGRMRSNPPSSDEEE